MKVDGEYKRQAERECNKYTGLGLTWHHAKKHGYALLTFAGESRKVFFPTTPGNGSPGALNFRQDIRRALRTLGILL